MVELELYGKVVNINKLFPQNDPHKKYIKTFKRKDSTYIQYTYKSVIETLSNNLQHPWMVEFGLYGKVFYISKLFPPNDPHKQNIKTLSHKDSTYMQYTYKSVIEILSNNFPTCANKTTGRTVLLNCDTWFQSEIVVGM